ncbi:hypothetical protein [Kitasatospora sp. NPDC008115]
MTAALESLVPDGLLADREMAVKLNRRNRPEPDLVVTTADELDRSTSA